MPDFMSQGVSNIRNLGDSVSISMIIRACIAKCLWLSLLLISLQKYNHMLWGFAFAYTHKRKREGGKAALDMTFMKKMRSAYFPGPYLSCKRTICLFSIASVLFKLFFIGPGAGRLCHPRSNDTILISFSMNVCRHSCVVPWSVGGLWGCGRFNFVAISWWGFWPVSAEVRR